MIGNVIDIPRREVRPEQVKPEALSAIELSFPRIAFELVSRWNGGDIDAYVDSLLIDTRGNRMGFPSDVLEEIMFLSGIRWYLAHGQDATPMSMESPKEEFSFCTDDFRRCGTTGGWVLI
jgi:hypothetical protein